MVTRVFCMVTRMLLSGYLDDLGSCRALLSGFKDVLGARVLLGSSGWLPGCC